MNKQIAIIVSLCSLLVGCVSSPVISKSKMGNLEINVLTADKSQPTYAEVFIDDTFIGNPSKELPVIHAKRGKHIIKIKLDGYKPYEREITILGDPNHQVLNVELEKQN